MQTISQTELKSAMAEIAQAVEVKIGALLPTTDLAEARVFDADRSW